MIARVRSLGARTPFPALLLPVLLLAFALRVIGLEFSDLSLDESITHYIVDRPALEIIRYCFVNVYEHPPTYYLFIRGWMRLAGETEFPLRFFSVAAGTLSVAFVAVLGRRWFGKEVGAAAGLLLAVAPMAVERSREARMYSLLPLAGLIVVLALDQAVRLNRWRDWALFLALLLFALSIHYFAAISLAAYAVLYVIWWRRRPKLRVKFGVTLAIPATALLLLLVAAPGPRESLAAFVTEALAEPWSLARVLPIFTGWVFGTLIDAWPAWLTLPVSIVAWLLFAYGLVERTQVAERTRDARLMLAVLVLLPVIAGSILLFYVSGRHHSFLSYLFVLGVALGLVSLVRRLPALGIVVALLLVGAALAVGLTQPLETGKSFSLPLAYVQERARAGEQVVYTYYFDRYQRDYYDKRDLPVYNVGNMNEPLDPGWVDLAMKELMAKEPSAWLILRPDEHNPEVVEAALDRYGFGAQKVWFPGGRRVNHYFPPAPLQEHNLPVEWEAGFRSARYGVSSGQVAAGDALRLQFEWQPVRKPEADGLVLLRLVGPDGETWAQRLGGPCNDRCPTEEWKDATLVDRQAFEIPADVPPGQYELRLGWIEPDGKQWLARRGDETVAQVDVPLMQVTVGEPVPADAGGPSAGPLPQRIDRHMGDALTLVSAGWDGTATQAGSKVVVPLQWAVSQPPGDAQVHLLLNRGGKEAHRVTLPLGPAWYPSSAWMAPRSVHTQPAFTIPAGAAPGEYELAVGVSAAGDGALLGQATIGRLTVQDRPRSYEVPSIGQEVAAGWAEGIELVRAEAPLTLKPGQTFDSTLIWRAGGPASRNWKVFYHLADETGEVRSQGDAFPAGGLAPATGWREGEVIVDRHTFAVPPDAPPGKYRLQVGFYDEATFERLAFAGGGDTFVLPFTVEITP